MPELGPGVGDRPRSYYDLLPELLWFQVDLGLFCSADLSMELGLPPRFCKELRMFDPISRPLPLSMLEANGCALNDFCALLPLLRLPA